MNRIPRHLTALLLLAVYTSVVMTLLAPLALRSPAFAHAVTGECVGECDICGCSPEARANHTCCCWKKKQQHDHERSCEQQGMANCCKKQHGKTVLSCGCPCGTKHLALWSGGKNEQMPHRFSAGLPAFHADDLSSAYRKRLTERHGDPPDKPPKIILLS